MKDAGHVRMDVSQQLREIDNNLAVIASFPQCKDKAVVIGESDPEGAAAAQGPQLQYRNGTLYSSYTAASFARKHLLADKHDSNLAGALTWAFEFEDQPYYAGFRVLASNDIDLPVLNVFRMFAKMNGHRIETTSSHQLALDAILKNSVRGSDADVGVIAAKDGQRTTIFAWHYHDDDVDGPSAAIELDIRGESSQTTIHYRIDKDHSNSYSRWLAMGSPQHPSPEQYTELQKAGLLAEYTGRTAVEAREGGTMLTFDLPRQGVSLIVVG